HKRVDIFAYKGSLASPNQ
ncbi:hypothetical protein KIPB_017035, partial [Kipferlia bialata]